MQRAAGVTSAPKDVIPRLLDWDGTLGTCGCQQREREVVVQLQRLGVDCVFLANASLKGCWQDGASKATTCLHQRSHSNAAGTLALNGKRVRRVQSLRTARVAVQMRFNHFKAR